MSSKLNSLDDLLARALACSERAASFGFDWSQASDVLDKMCEEIEEIRQAQRDEGPERIAEEVGDLFFTLVNYNRKMQIDLGLAFSKAIDKFEDRFEQVLVRLRQAGQSPENLSEEALNDVWDQVKSGE